MATVAGMGTTYNLPNYTGELFSIAPADTPFLSAIGGLDGYTGTVGVEFEWEVEGLESTSANNSRVEGMTAPAASEVDRANITNVVEIHQEAIEVSYTKQAARYLNGINVEGLESPVGKELDHQIDLKLRKIAIDVEKSFLNGTYVKPSTNATARQTRGLLPAILTNVNANGGTGRAVSKAIVDSTLSTMYANGAPLDQATTVFMVGPGQKVALSNLYAGTPALNTPTPSRNVGGIAVDTIVTDFGTFGVMVDRYMPTGVIAIASLGVVRPRVLEIPEKGFLFVEPLAKTGASDKFQIYGEIGLEYGPETFHGKITDLL